MEQVVRNAFEIEVVFSGAQQAEQQRQAEARQKPKTQNPEAVTDKRITKRWTNEEMHRIGLMGEHGYSAVTGTPVDQECGLSGNLRGDFLEFEKWIEVKTLQGYLAFSTLRDFRADFAVLAIFKPGQWDRVWMQGWIPKGEFEQHHFVKNFGYGEKLCFAPKDLLPMTTLKTHCYMAQKFNRVVRSLRG